MKTTTRRYSVILSIQTLLLIVDWNINIFALLARQSNALMLILFIYVYAINTLNLLILQGYKISQKKYKISRVQDACLITALSILLLTFFSTYVFQSGLVYLLYERFRTTLIICMFYFISTTVLHIWSLITRWNNLRYSWSTTFLVFFVAQRLLAAIYYYCYKRASLRISDPRFYEDVDLESDRLHASNNIQIQ